MTSVAEAATKREGFASRALSAVSFQRTAFRCYFCKESIRCQSTAQVDNTEHCYHTRLGKSKARFPGEAGLAFVQSCIRQFPFLKKFSGVRSVTAPISDLLNS